MGTLSIRLPDDVLDRLNKLAHATGRKKTYYAREAILRYLDDVEDLYLAESRWCEIQEGSSKTVPLEEIVDQLALEH